MAEPFFRAQPTPREIEERMEGYQSWLEVDLDCVNHNLEEIRRRVEVEVIPCVKANAYGHGLVPIVAHLMRRGVKRVLVAKLWEAMQLREAGLDCGIINIDPIFSETQYNYVVKEGITQAIFTREAADGLKKAAESIGLKAGVFVKVDTGLGRVGVRHEMAADFIEYVSSLPGLRLEGILSTFTEDRAYDKIQLERMLTIEKELRRRGIDPGTRSIASSNAILHMPESYLDAVRPGLTIYGVYPEEEDRGAGLELRQALSFKARIELVKRIEAGDPLTYNRGFIAQKRMRVGTIHAGYSDGYPRGLSNKGHVRVGTTMCRVLGSVSVNHHIIDLEGVEAREGDIVELIGRGGDNTINNLSKQAGITTYILCVGLNPLTPRIYFEGGTPIALSEPNLTNQ